MIAPSVQTSLTNARRYFREHLRVGYYDTEGESIEGVWFGEAAERLGLKGPLRENEFLALCDGNNPITGGPLTLRRNTTRKGQGMEKANRRVFFDFVYRPPKSVSILAFLEDDRLVGLHRKAVQASLSALERYAETRVGRGFTRRAWESARMIWAGRPLTTSTGCMPFTGDACERRREASPGDCVARSRRMRGARWHSGES